MSDLDKVVLQINSKELGGSDAAGRKLTPQDPVLDAIWKNIFRILRK